MSQDELARACETSVRNVSRWETGANLPRLSFLTDIARVTGKPVEWFFADAAALEPPAGSAGDMAAALLNQAIRAVVEQTVARILAENTVVRA